MNIIAKFNSLRRTLLIDRAEKERNQSKSENEELRTQLDQLVKRGVGEKPSKQVEVQLAEMQQRIGLTYLINILIAKLFKLVNRKKGIF